MGKTKWIGGLLGLLSGGPIGALAGFVLGTLFDNMSDDNGFATEGKTPRDAGSAEQVTRNGFLFSLLTLTSYIIKADGKIMHSEMETVRQFLRMNFGEAAVEEGNQIMLRLFERQKQMEAEQPGAYRQTILDCCLQLSAVMTLEQRLQLLNFLATIAKADGNIAAEEIHALREVAENLKLSESELNSMLGLGSTSLKDAYAVLEIEDTATDEEVRAAYKRMVVKHHPDRVASLGEDIRAAAEKKMREINEAKEMIYKSRGM